MKNIAFILILLSCRALYPQTPEGPNSPVSSSTSGLGIIWSNIDNGYASDDSRASTDDMQTGDISSNLIYTNFGFLISTISTTIVGIEVGIEKMRNSAGTGNMRDYTVMLTKDGVSGIGNNYANTTSNWSTSDAISTYGGSSDMWGETWTPGEVNSANFGIIIQARKRAPNGNARAQIDHVYITVYYNSSLPVDLLYFKIASTDNNVLSIRWSTASETNNDYFVLYSSLDAVKYDIIKKVKGSGNSSSLKVYEYDYINKSSDVTYYKLQQVDYDGKTEDLAVLAYKNEMTNFQNLRIYPNPMQLGSKLNIECSCRIDSVVYYNTSGRRIDAPTSVGLYIVVVNGCMYERFEIVDD